MNNLVNKTIESLMNNGFNVRYVNDRKEAFDVFWEIYNELKPKTISWGDSLTLQSVNLLDHLRKLPGVEFIETFHDTFSWEEKFDHRRKALTAELFLTGCNAITSRGQLVNLDMIGNRTSPIGFGPKNVVLFVGINKITETLIDGMDRVRKIAAPLNAKRHESLTTPCQKTGECSDCNSLDRICNTWSITEKSYPKGRITVILIDESLGL